MTTSTSSALHGASKVNGTLKFKKIVLSDDGVNEKYIPSLEPSEKTAAAKSGANHVLIYGKSADPNFGIKFTEYNQTFLWTR
ncbi:hypothetical protein C2G38_2150927 [Gigaspora rosea]|uniref:Uncharacterized protein n=1 Tax=Gigaspora rosea TaxID=44941 RepID=A0A397TYP6_9GLOM|nr:hypothetical protein C2G38_2150929 [Gigaspora rosea]RIB00273.1 hypothetical protein C2G38_2150927 [Gigaspora rosea]